MWNPASTPDRLTTPPGSNVTTDHYNNNPYSRNNSVNQQHSVSKGQQNSDPWNWGWDDNGSSSGQGSSGQDENDLWTAQQQSSHHQHLQQHHHNHQQQQFNSNVLSSNSTDFFENIDHSGSVSTTANNKLINQHSNQTQHHYSHHRTPQQLSQHLQHYSQQPQPPPPQPLPPQISTASSYSYFQFSDAQPVQPPNSTSLANQYPSSAVPQSQSHILSYNVSHNHSLSNYQQQPQSHPTQQTQFTTQSHNYNQYPSASFTPQQIPYNNTINSVNTSNISNNNNNVSNNNNISAEVENREIAPPEKTDKNLNSVLPPVIQQQPSSPPSPPAATLLSPSGITNSSSNNNDNKNSNIVPENQETVPENEERPPDPETVTASLNNLRLNSPPASELVVTSASSNDQQQQQQQWKSVSGWENQEVAPRCTVDRDQYLETGHLHPPPPIQQQPQNSTSATDNDVDVDTNDEGEAVPPPGLHRLVTGQGQTVGQERMVVGSPPPPQSSSSNSLSMLQRPQVPGHSMQQQSDLTNHPPLPPLGQRMIPGQLRDADMERMVLGSSGNSGNDNISGIQQSREQLQNNPVSQRTVPGGRSNDVQQSRDRDQQQSDSVSQRTVPGGSSTSSSSAGSSSSYTQDLQSEERLVLGRTTLDKGDDRLQQQTSTGAPHIVSTSSSTTLWSAATTNLVHQDTHSNTHQPSTYSGESEHSISQQPPRPPSNSNSLVGAEQSRSNSLVSDPPPGLHRMVLGHPDNTSRGGSASGDEMSQSGVPPPGLHRMVLGEQQQEQKQQPQEQQQQPSPSSQQSQQQLPSQPQGSNVENEEYDKDRDIDSDSDFRMNRRKNRRDSIEDDRDYPSDRERERDRRHLGPDYWDRRYDDRGRRHYKDRSHHTSYDHSPEYRSDEDLDRERDFRDHRGYRRPGRDRRYYEPHHYRDRNIYEDDYYYRENRTSRPSSRSGMEYPRRPGGTGGPHDYLPPRNVHPYYPDPGAYQMHYYQLQQQQYYEMRRNDPQAYAAWYERYMASKYGQSVHHPDDTRTSVHSGRSSANHHRSSNEKVLLDESGISVTSNKGMLNASGIPGTVPSSGSMDHHVNKEDNDKLGGVDVTSQRYTPLLYPRGAHIKGKLTKQGQLVVISPNYPQEGQPPIVEVMQLSYTSMQNEPDVSEFLESPGPFIVGVTHKNTVLQYLKKRADQATHNAEKLLSELIQLVIRLNGVVDMTDVADLLMANYNEDPGAEHDQHHLQQIQLQHQSGDHTGQQDNSNIVMTDSTVQSVTDRFRDLLLQGNKLDALEWAIQNKNWGHAFFLASKMDARSYNNVMLRFANGLPANDPLQTLYQMMSGREPQAASCCADKKWGDWRPHLAMMLSNPSGNPDLDRKSIITLGDSLVSKGRLFASHFCYVTAQVEFSAYADRSGKLALLGTSHNLPFSQFATCRSIMLTLCYEYAKRLNKKDLTIPALQVYKYLLATRLVENGKLAVASQYLEALALDMIHRPTRQNRSLALLVAELADQIKMADPALAIISDPNDDPDWLNTLKQILDDTNETNLQTSSMSHGISTSTVSTSAADPPPINQVVGGYNQDQMYYDNSLHAWNQPEMQNLDSMHYHSGFSSGPNIEIVDDPYQQQQQQMHQKQMNSLPNSVNGTIMNTEYNSMSSTLQQQSLQNPTAVSWEPNMYTTNSWQEQQSQHQQQPQAPSLPPVTTGISTTTSSPQDQQKPSPEKKPSKEESSNRRSGKKNKEQSSSGWFGGIFEKIALRPKNQMKLPDDKNPTIVWDEKKGRWVDKNADEEDESMSVKPPPKASELPGFPSSVPGSAPVPPALAPTPAPGPALVNSSTLDSTIPTAAPAAASTPTNVQSGVPTAAPSTNSVNMYKMQRGRGMKANYIDVMNPNTTKKTATSSAAPPPPLLDPVPAAMAPVNNFFIPAPVEGNENAPIDFVSPSGPVSYEASHGKALDQTTELSRSSSASSLSREVSNIMSRNQHQRMQSKPINNYTRHQQTQHAATNYQSQDVPTFYNPNSYTVT
ncbi:endoplasmic reticulum export factor secretory 16 isoform X2 [Lycorma delicatula]|uniref:endoplasmic reticulum export factor secretory 16 isoform X2 n=1 Tax=Lycorma delicatula TaxID=130591 RepID=UPI003F5166D5